MPGEYVNEPTLKDGEELPKDIPVYGYVDSELGRSLVRAQLTDRTVRYEVDELSQGFAFYSGVTLNRMVLEFTVSEQVLTLRGELEKRKGDLPATFLAYYARGEGKSSLELDPDEYGIILFDEALLGLHVDEWNILKDLASYLGIGDFDEDEFDVKGLAAKVMRELARQ